MPRLLYPAEIEAVLEFVPQDAFIVYAAISKDWHAAWKRKNRSCVSAAARFCDSLKMFKFALAAAASPRLLVVAACRGGRIGLLAEISSWNKLLMHFVMFEALQVGNLEVVEWLLAKGHPPCGGYTSFSRQVSFEVQWLLLKYGHDEWVSAYNFMAISDGCAVLRYTT